MTGVSEELIAALLGGTLPFCRPSTSVRPCAALHPLPRGPSPCWLSPFLPGLCGDEGPGASLARRAQGGARAHARPLKYGSPEGGEVGAVAQVSPGGGGGSSSGGGDAANAGTMSPL